MYYRRLGLRFDIDSPLRVASVGSFGRGTLPKFRHLWVALGITELADEPAPDYTLNHVVENPDGTYTETPKTQAELDAEVTDALSEKLEAVRMIGRLKRDEIVSHASPYEAASWSLKRAEAMAYDTARSATPPTHNPTLAPMLTVEAAVRGTALEVIVDRVIANSSALSQAEAAIAGSEGKHSDAIKTLTTAAEISHYDETAGWAI